jgi:hypothetical protein
MHPEDTSLVYLQKLSPLKFEPINNVSIIKLFLFLVLTGIYHVNIKEKVRES